MSKKGYQSRAKLSERRIARFRDTILDFYRTQKRVFPWRETNDSYAILVSEVMLQQTQARRVVPFFKAWMKRFPTVQALAKAPLRDMLVAWQGLGYNRRALNLRRAAEVIVGKYKGHIPRDIATLDALPGVGSYTARAIAAFAFGIASPFIETNIRSVYLHFFFKERTEVSDRELLSVIAKMLPKKEVREWYNALMDYGAMLKDTVGNPNIRSAEYSRQSKFKGSRRELRGRVLRRASLKGRVTSNDFKQHRSDFSVAEIFSELAKEGFLKKEGSGFRLT